MKGLRCGCAFLGDRFWATACKTVRRVLSDRCLSCLSVCDVGVLWPKMKLNMVVGLVPCLIVLDGDPASPKGAQPPIFGPCQLWLNG